MKYWIRDEDSTPQGFPLKMLIVAIFQQLGSMVGKIWIIRSQGYGLKINEWDDLLDKEDRLLVDPELLIEVSAGETEWFYDLDAEIVVNGLKIRFGLHDSTAMYIDAPKEFADKVVKSFELVAIADSVGDVG
jgi:hypothetical protein